MPPNEEKPKDEIPVSTPVTFVVAEPSASTNSPNTGWDDEMFV
jgi:hypothetical protein